MLRIASSKTTLFANISHESLSVPCLLVYESICVTKYPPIWHSTRAKITVGSELLLDGEREKGIFANVKKSQKVWKFVRICYYYKIDMRSKMNTYGFTNGTTQQSMHFLAFVTWQEALGSWFCRQSLWKSSILHQFSTWQICFECVDFSSAERPARALHSPLWFVWKVLDDSSVGLQQKYAKSTNSHFTEFRPTGPDQPD